MDKQGDLEARRNRNVVLIMNRKWERMGVEGGGGRGLGDGVNGSRS